MKGLIRDTIAFSILCHFWVSGALIAGISAKYWLDASNVVAGMVIAGTFLLSPVALWFLIDPDAPSPSQVAA